MMPRNAITIVKQLQYLYLVTKELQIRQDLQHLVTDERTMLLRMRKSSALLTPYSIIRIVLRVNQIKW